jgi:hypothetical protein
MSEPTLLGWIQRWYESECNGDWEHQYGVKIDTLDNPGWKVGIDLFKTELHDLQSQYGLEQRSDQDWVGISVTKQIFQGIGDPTKLEVCVASPKPGLLKAPKIVRRAHPQSIVATAIVGA